MFTNLGPMFTLCMSQKALPKLFIAICLKSDRLLGYEEDDENGEKVEVRGLKDKLESAYEELESNLESFNTRLSALEKTSQNRFEEWVSNNKKATENTKDEIKKLLPEALTAGLSHAYSAKKSDELEDYSGGVRNFV